MDEAQQSNLIEYGLPEKPKNVGKTKHVFIGFKELVTAPLEGARRYFLEDTYEQVSDKPTRVKFAKFVEVNEYSFVSDEEFIENEKPCIAKSREYLGQFKELLSIESSRCKKMQGIKSQIDECKKKNMVYQTLVNAVQKDTTQLKQSGDNLVKPQLDMPVRSSSQNAYKRTYSTIKPTPNKKDTLSPKVSKHNLKKQPVLFTSPSNSKKLHYYKQFISVIKPAKPKIALQHKELDVTNTKDIKEFVKRSVDKGLWESYYHPINTNKKLIRNTRDEETTSYLKKKLEEIKKVLANNVEEEAALN